jgi:hypothetical protein
MWIRIRFWKSFGSKSGLGARRHFAIILLKKFVLLMLQAEFFSTNAVCENLSFYFSSGPKFGSDTGTGVRIHSGSETDFGSDQTKRTEAFPYLRPFSPRTFCVLVAMMMISVLVGVTRTSTPLYPSSASSRVNSSFSSAYAQHYLEQDYTEHTLLLVLRIRIRDPVPF